MNIGQRLTKLETTINRGFINDPERIIAAMAKVMDTACSDIEGEPLMPPKEKVTKEEWALFIENSKETLSSEEIEEMKANIIKIGGFTDDMQSY